MNKLTENRIRKFKMFLDDLNESLDNIQYVNWFKKDEDEWNGDFIIDDKTFNILIKRVIMDDLKNDDFVYLTKFGLRENNLVNYKKLTDDNIHRSLTTLATVRHSLKSFMNEQKPNVLTFITSDTNESRIKLYQKFCDDVIDNNTSYYNFYHVYNKLPLFIICNFKFNILKIKNFYVYMYKMYQNYYNF